MTSLDEQSVIRTLNKKRDIKIKGNTIKINKNSTDLGKSTLGKIDYLINHCGYKKVLVDEVEENNQPKPKYNKYEEEDNSNKKTKNIIKNIKKIMKF